MIGHHRIGYINSIEALTDWQALGVGLVVDCTGRATERSGAQAHLETRLTPKGAALLRKAHRHVLRIEGKMLDGIADNERIRLAALLASCVANLSKATGKVLRMPALPANVRYRQ